MSLICKDKIFFKKVKKSVDISETICYYNIVARVKAGKEKNRMENEGMTNEQFKKFLQTILHILENEEKEKAIELIKSLLA